MFAGTIAVVAYVLLCSAITAYKVGVAHRNHGFIRGIVLGMYWAASTITGATLVALIAAVLIGML